MGCGESKHAVGTENTLIKSKSKSKSLENNPPVENAMNDGSVKKNEIPDGIQDGKGQPDHEGKKAENIVEEGNEISKKTDEKNGGSEAERKLEDAAVNVAVEGNKDEIKNEELEGEKEENGAKEETNASLVSEGVSGNSENDSPNVPEGKVEGNDAAEGKEKDGENDANKEKEEADEGKELLPAEETKSTAEEKISADENEKANAAAPAADVKAD